MVDPVKVTVMWQATCDSCGWHSPPSSPKHVVNEWARLHRMTCPLKTDGEQTVSSTGDGSPSERGE